MDGKRWFRQLLGGVVCLAIGWTGVDAQHAPVVPDTFHYDVQYDSLEHMYILTPYAPEDSFQIQPAGTPYYLTPDEFLLWQQQQLHDAYLQSLMYEYEAETDEEELPLPELPPIDESINKLFGSDFIHIKPSGQISLTAGYRHNKVDNPLLPETYRSYGQPDFDADLRFNIVGSIGELMTLNFNFDSRAQFDYENQLRIQYEGKEHHIIRSIQAGNISFSLPTGLISGVQNLMGLQTTLQFGRLSVSAVVAEQRSESQTLTFQGGARYQTIEIRADEYDAFRHFFLAHPFRNQYEQALSTPPVLRSPFRITRIEVWVTNRSGRPENARDVVAFADLGEPFPYRSAFQNASPPPVPSNDANTLYSVLIGDPGFRNAHTAVTAIQQNLGLQPGVDFEKVYARKLSEQEYTLHPELGYISLHISLQPDEVLAVAFEFTYNGRTYRVGEFSEEIPPGENQNQVLFLKLLKSTTTRTDIPLWDLMMKNIYALRTWQVDPQDFRVDIFYLDADGAYKRFIPEGSLQGIPLIQVLQLDRLDRQQRPRPDGVFDFLPGITIDPNRGLLIFPVLEPFGSYLQRRMAGEPHLWGRYVFQELYDSTKVQAQQFTAKNRYVIRVQYRSRSARNEIDLGRMNIPPGSVRVTAGGRLLQEGKDYTVDYTLGRVTIINPAILESGQQIQVSFENQDFVGFQRKFFLGLRATYWLNENLTLGATWLRLSRLPFTPKVDYEMLTYTNEIIGADLTFQAQSSLLTHLINKLPTVQSRTPSSVKIQAEVAHFMPKEPKGMRMEDRRLSTVFLDDFEGARQYYDLRIPVTAWHLASPPRGWRDLYGNRLFPETDSFNTRKPNYRRGLLSWYTIDPVFYQNTARTPEYIKQNPDYISDPYTHEVLEQEIFPEKESVYGTPVILQTLDLAFYPREPGPYNFNPNLTSEGFLPNPAESWAGIQQALYITDFEQSNIEYIELWLMDPFIHNPFSTGGYLYIHLGNLSEDVLPDGRLAYENGLPRDPQAEPEKVDTTIWGIVPTTPPVTRAFDIDPATRSAQDVGLDGLSDIQEQSFFSDWLNSIQSVVSPSAFQKILDDPSRDNFIHYMDSRWDQIQADIIQRYKYYSQPDGNSPVATGTELILASTNLPTTEDINQDNTLNQTEAYFQYIVRISPQDLQVGRNFVTDMVEATVNMPNGTTQRIRWYQIRIPVREFQHRVGSPDIRSIRFIRLLLTGFDTTVILRFGRVALVGSPWRIYERSLALPGEILPVDDEEQTTFEVSVVNIEENSRRQPVPYVLPPGIERERLPSGFSGTIIQQNEQSLSLKVCQLPDGGRRAVYRNVSFDLRQFQRLRLFIHAEATSQDPGLQDGEMVAFFRLGQDLSQNFYEIQVPLKLTPWGTSDPNLIWMSANEINILLDSLVEIKRMRDRTGFPLNRPFVYTLSNGHRIVIVGRPDLGKVLSLMLGIYNPPDDGQSHCVEVWFNELRVQGLKNYGGTAFRTSADIQLADVMNVGVAVEGHTPGFGALNQTIIERNQDYYLAMNVSVNAPLNRLLGISWLKLPAYLTMSQSVSTPRYHPFESDIVLKEWFRELPPQLRDSLRKVFQTRRTHRGLAFSGIQILTKRMGNVPWNPANFSFDLSWQEERFSDPYTEVRLRREWSLASAYSYSPQVPAWEPFKGWIKPQNRALRWLREFHINPLPQQFTWNNRFQRQFQKEQLRPLTAEEVRLPPYYDKNFVWTRQHSLRWNISRSLSANFSNQAEALILEPPGEVRGRTQRERILQQMARLGSPVRYQHTLNLRYTPPLQYFPVIKILQPTFQYNASYQWTAWTPARTQPLLDYATIQNSRTLSLNTQIRIPRLHQDLHKLYWWIRYRIEPPPTYLKQKQQWLRKLTLWKQKKAQGKDPGPRPKKPKYPRPPSSPKTPAGKTISQAFQSFQNIRITFSREERTIIPGFTAHPRFIGLDSALQAPGIPFLAGWQPDTSILSEFARRGWLTRDSLLALPFEQHRTDRIEGSATWNFFRFVQVTLRASYSFSQMYEEIFRDTTGTGQAFAHLSPITRGNFSVSVIAWGSFLWDRIDRTTYRSRSLERFVEHTRLFSARLAQTNPSSQNPIDSLPGYWEGYGPTAPQVILPAFVATYLRKDPNQIPLREYFFPVVPLPGWTIQITSLQKLPGLKKILRSASISHSYQATYSIGAFKSSFYYQELQGVEGALHPVTGNFIPPYEFTGVQLEERFAPLLGINLTFQNRMTLSFQSNRMRTLQLNFANYRLNEILNQNYTLNVSGKIRKVWLPRLRRSRQSGPRRGRARSTSGWVELAKPADLSLRASYSYTINITHDLFRNLSVPTTGIVSIRFTPGVMYEPIKNLRIRFFVEYNKTIPLTSQGFPTRTFFIGATGTYTLSGF